MNLKSDLFGDEKSFFATLLLILSIHPSISQCITAVDSTNCVRNVTCEGIGSRISQEICKHDPNGQPVFYKINVIFININKEFKTTEFLNQVDSLYYNSYQKHLNLLSLRNNFLLINPLAGIPTSLFIKHIDLSYNRFREFDLKVLHNIQNLETFDLSNNYISDLRGPTEEQISNLMDSLSVLDLSHNQIESVEKNIFSSFSNLKSLDLSYNNISYISFYSFIDLDKLVNLNLSFNILKEFNMALFELKNLEYLDASYNSLSILYKQDLMKSIHLKQLNVQNNNLKKLDPEIFASLNELEMLNISHNQFADSLNVSLFKNNFNLISVDLSFNGISCLLQNAFSSQSLEKFEVNGNKLGGILVSEYFNGMSSVTSLDLSHQYLTGISNNTFHKMNDLEILNLSYNEIFLLEHKAFVMLFNLTSVDLSHNRLTTISFDYGNLISLKRLKLNNNLITIINDKTFENLNSLEELDISDNTIEYLCAECLPLGSLKYIFLKNNTCSKIDAKSFTSLSQINELDISHFKLSRLLNSTFQGLSSTTVLNISNNYIEFVEKSAFSGLMNLITLDISNNFLNSFIIDTLDLPNLVTLKLHSNRLSTITSLSSFHNLNVLDVSNNSLNEFIIPNIKISSLYLENNNICYIKYSSNMTTNLRKINLKSNKIQDITLLNLAKNVYIQEIYLAKNLIESVDITSFSSLKELIILDISNNLISVVSPGIFLELENLEILDISHNKIHDIKLGAFNGLNDLQIIDISFNSLANIHIDIFYPLTLITDIVLDHNKISIIEDIKTFVRPLTTLSLGGNPLDCRWLSSILKFISYKNTFKLQALYNNFTGENFDGITCVNQNAQAVSTKSNLILPHDIGPHLSNLTHSLSNILDNNISIPSSIPNSNLVPYLLNVTNLLEQILKKDYSFSIEKDNIDLNTKKHYDQIETVMGQILQELKQINSKNTILESRNVSVLDKSQDVTRELKKYDENLVAINELKAEILSLRENFIDSIILRDQMFDSFVANLTKSLDKLRMLPVSSKAEILSQMMSDKTQVTNEAYTYTSHIKVTEAFVIIILIILLSVITYKAYLSKILSRNRRLQRESIQNLPMT